jgi:hypothetical protein
MVPVHAKEQPTKVEERMITLKEFKANTNKLREIELDYLEKLFTDGKYLDCEKLYHQFHDIWQMQIRIMYAGNKFKKTEANKSYFESIYKPEIL